MPSSEEIMAAPSASETQNTKIDTLKAEGDAFFCQKRFREAHSKYSEAIDLDGNIVVLYNNRAASALSMNECVTILMREIDILILCTQIP